MTSTSEIQKVQLWRASIYINYSSGALYLFESCLVFSREIEVVWRRRWSATTWIYVLSHYSSLLLTIFSIVPIWGFVDCNVTVHLQDALALLQFLCFAFFSALRVYALLGGKTLVAGIVFVFTFVPAVTDLYSYTQSTSVLTSESLCIVTSTVPEDINLGLTSATRVSVIIGDALVLWVTWTKTAKSYREARRLKINAPIATLMFRDGTFYFIVLLGMNVLQIIERNISSFSTLGLSQFLLETATPIIICRFILDLRQVKVSDSSQNSRTQPSSIRFVGNAGESLQFEDDGDEEELSIQADDFDSPHGVDDIGVNRSTTSGMTASSFDSHTGSDIRAGCYSVSRKQENDSSFSGAS